MEVTERETWKRCDELKWTNNNTVKPLYNNLSCSDIVLLL